MNQTKKTIMDTLRYCLPCIALLFISYFLYAGLSGYSARVTGQFFNAVLGNSHSLARGMFGVMLLTLVTGVIIMPAIDLITNIIAFHYGLHHDLYITGTFFQKSYESASGYSPGELVQRLFRDPLGLRTLLIFMPTRMLAEVSVLIFMVILMLQISPILAGVNIALSTLGAICTILFARKMARLAEEKKRFEDRSAEIELEMVANRGFYQSYGINRFSMLRQEDAYKTFFFHALKRGIWFEAMAGILPQCFLMMGNIAFILIGSRLVLAQRMQVGDLTVFFSYLVIITDLASQLCEQGKQMAQLPQSTARVAALTGCMERKGGSPIDKWQKIKAHQLSFRYSQNDELFNGKDFEILRNDIIQISGDNGAGKTTLIRLLCGLLRPSSGKVCVDDADIENLDLEKWRNEIAYAEQIPTIFQGTVRENVHIGNLNVSHQRVDDILKRLQLYEQADRQINTLQQLSGGELRKIALGRVLLRDSNIVILDEPFENLDIPGRQVVDEILANEDKTRICIIHGKHHALSCVKTVQL